jgi:hypothetical protein
MRRGALLVVSALAALGCGLHSAVAARPHLVFRIDKVSAMVEGGTLTIDASGAVQSGGWSHPRLRTKPSAPETPVLQVEFVADPPPPKRIVINALLPIKAEFRGPFPKNSTVAITVGSQTNEITTQIRRSR